ncbi:MAG: hypothetical protein R3C49_27710 [Planctomycetaceae bacterium]
MQTWLANPGVLALGGSWLTPQDIIAAQNWEEITRRASAARALADEVRSASEK